MILSISHADLDGIWSQILLSKKHKNIQFLRTGYKDLEHKLNNISYSMYEKVIVSDLNLKDIYLKPNIDNIMIFDHHYKPNYPCEIIFDDSISACMLIDNHYNINNEITKYVNAFDIWDRNSDYFENGFILNCYFWEKGINAFYNRFKQNENIEDIKKWFYNNHKQEVEQYFNKLEKKNLLVKGNDIIISFTDINQHWLGYLYDYKFIINATSYGRITVRTVNDIILPNLDGFKGTNHTKVFQGSVSDNYDLEKVKQVVEILEGIE